MAPAAQDQAINLVWKNNQRRDYVLTAVKECGRALQFAAPELKADREVVLQALAQDGTALQFAAPELQGDADVALTAVAQSHRATAFVKAELLAQRAWLQRALAANARVLTELPEATGVRGDRELLSLALRQDGRLLAAATDALRRDRQLVLEALEAPLHGAAWALELAPAKLRGDRELVLRAAAGPPAAAAYDDEAAVRSDDRERDRDRPGASAVLLQAPAPLREEDRELRLAAAPQAWRERWRGRTEVLRAVDGEGYRLRFATEELRAEAEVVLRAVLQNHTALEHAAPALRGDLAFMAEAAELNFRALEFASPDLQNDKELISRAVAQDGRALQFASEELRGEKSVVLRAVLQNPKAFQYATEELRSNRDVVVEAMAIDRSVLMFASEAVRSDRQVWLYSGRKPDVVFEKGEVRPLDAARRCGIHPLLSDDLLLWLESEPVRDALTKAELELDNESTGGLDHVGVQARRRSAEMLGTTVARGALEQPAMAQVLCGDFNSTKMGEAYEVLCPGAHRGEREGAPAADARRVPGALHLQTGLMDTAHAARHCKSVPSTIHRFQGLDFSSSRGDGTVELGLGTPSESSDSDCRARSRHHQRHIDWVLWNDGHGAGALHLEPISFEVITDVMSNGRYPSDHFPVSVSFEASP